MQNIEEKTKFEIAHCAETATNNKEKTSQCACGTTSIRNGNGLYQKTHENSQKFVKSRSVGPKIQPLSLPSYNDSALKSDLNFCDGYLMPCPSM